MSQPIDSSDAFAELQSQLTGDLRPVKPFVPGRWMLCFLCVFTPLTALALWRVFGWRSDYGVLGDPGMWGLSAVEMVAACMLLGRVLREAVPARSSSLTLLTLGAAGTMLLHVAVSVATFAKSPAYAPAEHAWAIGVYCYRFEVALGIPCILFALWLGGRGLTSRPRRLGILGGVGAGLAADALWRLVCPYTGPAHAFGSHTLGILTVVVVGLMLAGIWEMGRARMHRAATKARS